MNKTVFFGLVVLFLLITTGISSAYAQTSDYTAYKNLFSGSTLTYSGPLVDKSTSTVPGLDFNFAINFSSTDEDVLKTLWSNVNPPSSNEDTFIIKSCLAADGSSCAYARVPFDTAPSASTLTTMEKWFNWATYVHPIRIGATVWNYIEGTDGITTEIAEKYNVEVSNSLNSSLVVFEKDQNGNYLVSRQVDVLTTNWFNADGSQYPVSNFVQTKSRTASIWYCAQQGYSLDANGNDLQNPDPGPAYGSGDPSITQFSGLCNGGSYFKIADIPTPLVPPQTFSDAVSQNAAITSAASSAANTTTTSGNLPECGLGLGSVATSAGLHGTINGCAADIAYGIYWLCAEVAGLFGTLFDFFIGYSLSDTSYRYPFVVTGWDLVRDISNIFFIIIMVWTGFSAVFDTNTTNMKKVVPNLIINALLINFSLFATRVVIDISNITARVFYNQMVVCKATDVASGNCSSTNELTSTGGYPSLSVKIVSAFNPQKMFNPSVLNPPTTNTTGTNQTVTQSTTNTNVTVPSAYQTAIYFGVVSLIAAALMILIAIMFFKVSFLFVGRVVGLYICMIFSPFAFMSRDIPMLGTVERLRWVDWSKELMSYAMLAPVFVFFLYIIYTFLSSNFVQQIGVSALASSGFFETVMSITIPMLIIFFLLQAAQKTAEKLSGDIGRSIQKFGEQATGLAIGAATGGTALLGSRVIGGAAKKLDESRVGIGIRNLSSKSGIAGWTGRTLQKGINNTRSGSFDVRQSTVGNKFFGALGINTDNKALNALAGVGLGLGTDQRKGGNEADIKRRQEAREKDDKLLEEKMSDEQIKAYNERKSKQREKQIQKETDNIVEPEMATRNNLSAKQLKEWKKNNKATYDAEKATILSNPQINSQVQQKVDAVPPATQIKSAAELTSTRRDEFSKNLEKGGLLTQALTKLAGTGEGGRIASNILAGSLGALIGEDVRTSGDRKAAKKIKEKNKISQDLEKINKTLAKGFQDMIALEMFQTSAGFMQLNQTEQADIVRDGLIQSGVNKGKSMYDILDTTEKAAVDTKNKEVNTKLSDPTLEKARQEELNQYQELVKVREQSKYNIKDIDRHLSRAKDAWVADPSNQNLKQAFLDELKEKKKAETHLETWQNIGKHIEEQRKKLKEE